MSDVAGKSEAAGSSTSPSSPSSTTSAAAAPTAPGRGRSIDIAAGPDVGPPWLGVMWHRVQIDLRWLAVTGIMLAAGLVFFGWRALLTVSTAAMAAMATFLVVGMLLGHLRPHRPRESSLYGLWLGLLTGLCLPAGRDPLLPLLCGAAVGLLAHVVGRSHRLRVHPVVLVLVLLTVLPATIFRVSPERIRQSMAQPVQAVLRPNYLVVGDVADATPVVSTRPWVTSAALTTDAVRRHPPHSLIMRERQRILDHPPMLTRLLSSGELAPLEELLLGAVPGPIGASSPALLLALGLYLMYLRLAHWPTAVAALLGAVVTYPLLPIAAGDETQVVLHRLVELGPARAATLMSYVMLGSTLPLMVMILAPGTAPMSRQGRMAYGLIIGCGAMIAFWWLPVPEAGYLALAIAGLLSRPLDALHHSAFVE